MPSHPEGRNGEEAGKRSRRRRRQRGADNVRRTAAATAERERGRRKANSLGSGTGNHIKKAVLPLEAAKNLEILTCNVWEQGAAIASYYCPCSSSKICWYSTFDCMFNK